jgi:hypothetical protein
MNFFGINRAALNGFASNIVQGAAQSASTIALMAATATITQFAGAAASTNSGATAIGLRTAQGAGASICTVTATASGALLTLANVLVSTQSSIRVTNTDAYAASSSSGQATGFITRNGQATSTSLSGGSAAPLLTAGTTSYVNVLSGVRADASLKLSGSSNWLIDGYSRVLPSIGIAANASKTALGYAVASAFSDANADAIKSHGAAAVIACQSSAIATGGNETAYISCLSAAYASASVLRYLGAAISVASNLSATPSLITPAGDVLIDCGSDMTAGERIAARGYALMVSASSMSASERFGIRGEAVIAVLPQVLATGFIRKECSSDINCYSDSYAMPNAIRFGASQIQSHSSASAFALSNALNDAPEGRTMRIPYVDTLMKIPYVDNLMRIPK